MDTRPAGRRLRVALLVCSSSLLVGCQVLSQPLPTSTAPAPPPPAGSLGEQLAALQIAPEDTGAHYDRDDWLPQWARSGECSTRETVLQQQGQGVVMGGNCAPRSGQWLSAYDGVMVTDPRDLDIDHIVPLAEAARSGPVVEGRRQRPGDWPEEQRRAYANDIEGLVAVTSSSNRSKGDDDPARWLPDRDRCGYVAAWLKVKRKYNLSVDQAEHDAIASVAGTCG
ncbi:MAG TPA: HNH endonuclease family protein [Actinophytocola sp.]